MSQPLGSWATQILEKYERVEDAEFNTVIFNRDPTRPNVIDRNYFYSPADGILMYQKEISNTNELVDIKGVAYKIKEILGEDSVGAALVIGIFMTCYDVHINRIPYAGFLQFKQLEPILSYNVPMTLTGHYLIRDKFTPAYDAMDYLRYNARMINRIYVPELDYSYYVTQIADDEVSVIAHFTAKQNSWFHQNQKFSSLRFGSHVELVLPLREDLKFETLVQVGYHVEACIDKLVRIERF
jgi:phosphatidylserine decarboxylase